MHPIQTSALTDIYLFFIAFSCQALIPPTNLSGNHSPPIPPLPHLAPSVSLIAPTRITFLTIPPIAFIPTIPAPRSPTPLPSRPAPPFTLPLPPRHTLSISSYLPAFPAFQPPGYLSPLPYFPLPHSPLIRAQDVCKSRGYEKE